MSSLQLRYQLIHSCSTTTISPCCTQLNILPIFSLANSFDPFPWVVHSYIIRLDLWANILKQSNLQTYLVNCRQYLMLYKWICNIRENSNTFSFKYHISAYQLRNSVTISTVQLTVILLCLKTISETAAYSK